MRPKCPSGPSGGDGITALFPAARVSREYVSLGMSLTAVVVKSQHSVVRGARTEPLLIPHPCGVLRCRTEVPAVPSGAAPGVHFCRWHRG